MRDAGFDPAFSRSGAGYRVFNHPLVITALGEIAERNKVVVDITVEEIVEGFRSIAFPAEGVKVANNDKNTALANLARYKNMLTDKIIIEGSLETPEDLSAEDRKQLLDLSRMASLRPKTGTDD